MNCVHGSLKCFFLNKKKPFILYLYQEHDDVRIGFLSQLNPISEKYIFHYTLRYLHSFTKILYRSEYHPFPNHRSRYLFIWCHKILFHSLWHFPKTTKTNKDNKSKCFHRKSINLYIQKTENVLEGAVSNYICYFFFLSAIKLRQRRLTEFIIDFFFNKFVFVSVVWCARKRKKGQFLESRIFHVKYVEWKFADAVLVLLFAFL